MPFGRKSPFEALALPGVILAYKYSQFRQRRREAANRRVTERELSALHHKIDILLSKLEESEPEPPTSQEDECVICINARATMQTSPCGHRVVCRRCFVKTIQSAVAQRLLPLRCVICRARVNRLTSSSGTWRIQESASSYSMGGKSWASAGVPEGGVPASASSYSMNDAHSGRHTFHPTPLSGRFQRSPKGPKVSQSDSLYSMSSTGSTLSGVSHLSAFSKTSSISSGLCSPASPISPSANSYTGSSILNNRLAPPSHSISQSPSPTSSLANSLSPRSEHRSHHSGCPSGCSGAIPRKPASSSSSASTSRSSSCSSASSSNQTYPGRRHNKGRLVDLQNRLPPIKEFKSPAKVPHPSPVHISNPRFRRYASYTKSNSAQEMAPLLKEPASPPKRPMNIHIPNSLTSLGPPPLKSSGSKISPLQSKSSIPKNAFNPNKDKRPNSAGPKPSSSISSCSKSTASSYANSGRPNYAGYTSSKSNASTSTAASGSNLKKGTPSNEANPSISAPSNSKISTTSSSTTSSSFQSTKAVAKTSSCQNNSSNATTTQNTTSSHYNNSDNNKPVTKVQHSSSIRSFQLFSSTSNQKERSDNKKNESMERKKKEEKQKLKSEKEARKVSDIFNTETKTKTKTNHNINNENGNAKIQFKNNNNNNNNNKNKNHINVGDNGGRRCRDIEGSNFGRLLFCFYEHGAFAAWKAVLEEKRLAKEEERMAKLLAKEEKKKGKKEAKELLLANDGNSKK